MIIDFPHNLVNKLRLRNKPKIGILNQCFCIISKKQMFQEMKHKKSPDILKLLNTQQISEMVSQLLKDEQRTLILQYKSKYGFDKSHLPNKFLAQYQDQRCYKKEKVIEPHSSTILEPIKDTIYAYDQEIENSRRRL